MHKNYKYLLFVMLAAIPAATPDDCQRKCGDINIPFPFGTTRECSLSQDFLIACLDSNPFFPNTNTSILDISVEGQIRVAVSSAYDCYHEGSSTEQKLLDMKFEFPISHTRNKFTAIGCDTNAIIGGLERKPYTTGCISYCESVADMINGSCTGMGCCETSLPKAAIIDFSIQIISFFDHQLVDDFNPCSYAFVADANWYNFSSLDLAHMPGDHDLAGIPVVLDWAVGNESCEFAREKVESFGCKAENSICYNSDNGLGYRCMCPHGFAGNPYIVDGCHDVNECEIAAVNQCSHICENTIGNFSCYCPKGYHGDGRKGGTGCILRSRSAFLNTQTGLVIGGSLSLAILFLSMGFVILGIHKRSIQKLRKENFKQNGGFLLQKLLTKTKHSEDRASKLISEEELNKATDNFNKNTVIGQGGFGVVYKGTLSDKTIVAIKRAKAIDQAQVEQFINEVIVLSRIYHPNVVKLMGCCLETSVPLLVYEFITNGTLFQHLHNPNRVESLPWVTRLRIAEETAAALAYMHSMQIIHRDVKSANILLDDAFTAKVSDFGVSRLVPFDEKEICTLVQGTFGYMDPEYFQLGILTEKSDVYSFGVVLVELMTGKKAVRSECEEKSLVLYFISSMKRNKLNEILDERVKEEGTKRDIKKVGEIAMKCLRLEGEMRPTMQQVGQELHILRQPKK